MIDTKKLAKEYEIVPKKSLGQNFLLDETPILQLIKAADISNKDTVVEIGPGLGILTKHLINSAKKVIAIEKDEKLSEILRQELKDADNLEIITKDILEWKPTIKEGYKVVGNLPYAIGTPIIQKFLQEKHLPESMTFMLQKEVAQRIASKPPDMGILALSVQIYSNPKIISFVKKDVFWPKPKVDSAIIHISNIKTPIDIDIEKFFSVVKAGFTHPRKQLINNLSQAFNISKEKAHDFISKNDIKPTQRAETLSLKDWVKLSGDDIIKKYDSGKK